MADNEVKIVFTTEADTKGATIVSDKIAGLSKQLDEANKDAAASYKVLTKEQVETALGTEKLTGKKSALLQAFKGLKNTIPGVGILLKTLSNPLTAIAAAFAAAKYAVDAYARAVNQAAEDQDAIGRSILDVDIVGNMKAQTEAAREFETAMRGVATATEWASKNVKDFVEYSQGFGGVQDKVDSANEEADLADIRASGMSEEEKATQIAATRERYARGRQGRRRTAAAGAIDLMQANIGGMESALAATLAGMPTDEQIKQQTELAARAKLEKERRQKAYESGKGGPGAIASLLLTTEEARAMSPASLKQDVDIATGTAATEQQRLDDMLKRQAEGRKRALELRTGISRMREQHGAAVVREGLQQSEEWGVRQATGRLNAVAISQARSQDEERLARTQEQTNEWGSKVIQGQEMINGVLRGLANQMEQMRSERKHGFDRSAK